MVDYGELVNRLWDVTKTDWHVELRNVLTEPVCCYVDLIPDDESFPSLRGFIGVYDANTSIRNAIEYHLRTLSQIVPKVNK